MFPRKMSQASKRRRSRRGSVSLVLAGICWHHGMPVCGLARSY